MSRAPLVAYFLADNGKKLITVRRAVPGRASTALELRAAQATGYTNGSSTQVTGKHVTYIVFVGRTQILKHDGGVLAHPATHFIARIWISNRIEEYNIVRFCNQLQADIDIPFINGIELIGEGGQLLENQILGATIILGKFSGGSAGEAIDIVIYRISCQALSLFRTRFSEANTRGCLFGQFIVCRRHFHPCGQLVASGVFGKIKPVVHHIIYTLPFSNGLYVFNPLVRIGNHGTEVPSGRDRYAYLHTWCIHRHTAVCAYFRMKCLERRIHHPRFGHGEHFPAAIRQWKRYPVCALTSFRCKFPGSPLQPGGDSRVIQRKSRITQRLMCTLCVVGQTD